jgi:deoxyuridine 5'-triphosphate nucleotidohydrolase
MEQSGYFMNVNEFPVYIHIGEVSSWSDYRGEFIMKKENNKYKVDYKDSKEYFIEWDGKNWIETSENGKKKYKPVLLFKRMHSQAIIPKMTSPLAAGYDLFADFITEPKRINKEFVKGQEELRDLEKFTIFPSKGVLIGTGVKIAIPHGYYGRIAPRSSIAMKHIDVGAGVFDADSRDEIRVLLYNLSTDKEFVIKKGDAIAQI